MLFWVLVFIQAVVGRVSWILFQSWGGAASDDIGCDWVGVVCVCVCNGLGLVVYIDETGWMPLDSIAKGDSVKKQQWELSTPCRSVDAFDRSCS